MTMLEARAFVPMEITRPPRSVRTGHVPVMENPARITAPKNVSQPVLVIPSFPTSDCLTA